MARRKIIKNQIPFILMLTLVISASCNQAQREASAPQDSLVKNIVDLKGLYRLVPENKSLSVDIKIDFKESDNSDWVTNINGNNDTIPKKYRIFADALYVTHDHAEFNRVIEEQRAKGQELTAKIAEEIVSKIPPVDKYRIELTDSDTIKLYGSRVNFNLIKIK